MSGASSRKRAACTRRCSSHASWYSTASAPNPIRTNRNSLTASASLEASSGTRNKRSTCVRHVTRPRHCTSGRCPSARRSILTRSDECPSNCATTCSRSATFAPFKRPKGLLTGNPGHLGGPKAAQRPERQETAPQMTERPAQRTPNRQLAALIAEAGFSNAGLARRVDQLGLEHGLDLRYDKTSVTRWLRGQQPRGTTPALIAEVFTRRLGQPAQRTGPRPRRVRPGVRRARVRRDPRGGRRHRQRPLAQGLRQPRRAAQDRLHPGGTRRPQPGLAHREGRRPGEPRRPRARTRPRAGPPRRAPAAQPDRARPRPEGHRRRHRRAALGGRTLPHPRPRLRRRTCTPGPGPLPGARGRADAARRVRRADRAAPVRRHRRPHQAHAAGPRTTSPRTGSPSGTSSRRCASRRRQGTGRTAPMCW